MLAALLDLGVPLSHLQRELEKLSLPNWKVEEKSVQRGGVSCRSIEFIGSSNAEPHREFREIRELIESAPLTERTKRLSLSAFWELARAEGKIHGLPPEKVHFHEVGAVDSILDIVGSAIALEYLGAELYASPLPFSRGWVDTHHGKLPLPAPATAELLTGIPVYPETVSFEFVTPTGVAMLKAWSQGFGPIPPGKVIAVGRGAGKLTPPDGRPNFLRLFLLERGGDRVEPAGLELSRVEELSQLWIVETNLDDAPPYLLGYLQEKLLNAGALDVWIESIYMKKNRPAHKLSALTPPEKLKTIREVIFDETPTLGVRLLPIRRIALKRESETVDTEFGPVRVKVAPRPTRLTAQPEYDDCRKLAQSHSIPLQEVYREVVEQWERKKRPPTEK